MNTSPHRPIRSFVKRPGRLTPAQSRALTQLWERYVVEFDSQPLQWEAIFPLSQPIILEIGFGNGDTLAQMAEAQPHHNYYGIEVHSAGVGHLLHRIEAAKLSNVRIACADAVQVIEKSIPDTTLAGVQIFFPDPWPKRRHQKRRLIQPEFVERLLQKLIPGGFIHFATDWEDYAYHALEILNSESKLSNLSPEKTFIEKPSHRPTTKFEQRGIELGHKIWDLWFIKKG